MNLAIIGAGGFGREVAAWARPFYETVTFYVEPEYEGIPLTEIPKKDRVVVAIANPIQRQRIVESLPKETKWATLIHPTVKVLDDNILIGKGSIICAGCILTTNIKIGAHSHLNLNTTVGHDCRLDNYFTTAPAANISGNVETGQRVYVGTNASIREKVKINNDVTIGMGSIVLNDITERGTYKGLVK
jgi:sugar O-acyltransferase (sialic acid O-acetyltransferase NeuD family)